MQQFFLEAIVAIACLSIAPIAAAAFAGGIVALFQAATQVQEPGLVHLARLIGFGLALFFGGRYGFELVEAIFIRSFLLIGGLNT